MNHKIKNGLLAVLAGCTVACTSPSNDSALLPSWNDTPVKQKILDYVENEVDKIPVEDRIAVFDMDGTIACEQPLWFEMNVAVHRMVELQEKDSTLRNLTEFKYARMLDANPNDTAVTNNWFVNGANYLDSIIMKAFAGMEHEDYVTYARDFLTQTDAPKYGKYADLFYQPMMELLDLLKQKQFQIYIVSGSMQGLVWSICPQTVDLDRQHLLGTRQNMVVSFEKDQPASYIIQKSVIQPKNNYYGKSVNIYNHIGKIPVIAIGNSVGDFGMFHLASSSTYPHFVMMLNHDDAEREYAYPPFYEGNPNWQDSIKINNWLQADMSKEFKTVWKNK